MSQLALQMRQISKTYGTIRANDRIDFSVKTGTIHALAGENGAGKSTLMKILFGLVEPDENSGSEILVRGKPAKFSSPLDAIKSGIGMVQQHFALAGALTALDNIILGAEPGNGFFVDREGATSTLIDLSGDQLRVPWSEEVDGLSVGLQQRIEILKLLFRQTDILILDEPTAVLTPQEVETFFNLLNNLRAKGKTVILISHKLREVLELCDEVTVLRQGGVTGTFSTKGLTQDQLVEAMIGRPVKPITKDPCNPGPVLLEAKDVRVTDTLRGALNGVTFTLHDREIVGIAGVEGHGQQALVESILGLKSFDGSYFYRGRPMPRTTAEVRGKLNVGLISEDRHDQSLWLDASMADNCAIGFAMKFSKFGFLNERKMRAHAEEILAPYGVKMESVRAPVKALSGGNQQKVVVAREVSSRKPDLLIASQPTRGVDVGAIEFIHQQIFNLRAQGAGILLISSELEELCALSDRILVLYEGRIAASFSGPDYDLSRLGRVMTTGHDI